MGTRMGGLKAIALAAALAFPAPGAAQQSTQEAAEAAWRAGDRARAEQLYAELLRADPNDAQALHRTATLLAWRGRYAESLALYDRLLRSAPDNMEARAGRARVLAWSGEHAAAAAEYERILASHPEDVDVLVGLAQVRRWQNQHRTALDLLERAERLAPQNTDVREQLLLVRAALATTVRSALVYENDSDDNDVVTLSVTGGVPLAARTRLRIDGYARNAAVPTGSERAFGLAGGLSHQLRSGWLASAGAGAAVRDGAGFDPILLLNAALSTPTTRTAVLTLSFNQSALDYTAAQITRELVTRELMADVRARLGGFDGSAYASSTDYESRAFGEDNRRWDAQLAVSRSFARVWTVGLRGRTFGFSEDTQDGYFDPERFALAEVTARYQRETRHWFAMLEAAPGVQRTQPHEGDVDSSRSLRATTRLTHLFAPGREFGVTATWARSGEQQLASGGDADYRYVALGIVGAIAF